MMAQALQIDTLAFSKKLRDAGADEKLADAIVEGITAADTSELATKTDLRDAVAKLDSNMATKAELRDAVAKLDAKIDTSVKALDEKIDTSVKALDEKIDTSVKALVENQIEISADLRWIKLIGGVAVTLLVLPLLTDLANAVLK